MTTQAKAASTPIERRHDIARKYGYRLRSSLHGDFLSAGSDDLMKIDNQNDIIIYAHDANAYFVANLIRNTPK